MTSMHEDAADGPTLRFRSYTPRDEQLQALCIALPQPADADALLKKFYELDPDESEDENAPLSLAPKNPNWDLKRDIGKQLDVLELQTQQAIIELIREKLRDAASDAAAGGDADDNQLNEAIDAQVRAAQMEAEED